MPIRKNKYKKFSDEKLMVLIQHADTFAFNEIYHRYSQRLLYYFFRMLGGDENKAQDFLQDLFLKVVEKFDSFNTVKNFFSWIFTIAHNMCKNEYRSQEVRKIVENNYDLDSIAINSNNELNPIERSVDQKYFKSAIFKELEKLNDMQRSTFLLKYQENFTIKEISEILGCSVGTTKSRLFYTTKKLANKLKAFHPNEVEVKLYAKHKQ